MACPDFLLVSGRDTLNKLFLASHWAKGLDFTTSTISCGHINSDTIYTLSFPPGLTHGRETKTGKICNGEGQGCKQRLPRAILGEEVCWFASRGKRGICDQEAITLL